MSLYVMVLYYIHNMMFYVIVDMLGKYKTTFLG